MKLTPGQIREALGLSQDAFRGWRATLSPLQGRSGYTPCFTPADLLALAVVKTLIDGAGVRVGALTPVAATLFDITNRTSWPLLQRSVLVFNLRAAEIALVPETQTPGTASVDLRVACRPIVAMLEEWLRGEQTTDNQHILRFPLSSIESERRAVGGDA